MAVFQLVPVVLQLVPVVLQLVPVVLQLALVVLQLVQPHQNLEVVQVVVREGVEMLLVPSLLISMVMALNSPH